MLTTDERTELTITDNQCNITKETDGEKQIDEKEKEKQIGYGPLIRIASEYGHDFYFQRTLGCIFAILNGAMMPLFCLLWRFVFCFLEYK